MFLFSHCEHAGICVDTPYAFQEIDELVDEWIPEPLAQPLTTTEQSDLAAVPIIAGPNGHKPKLIGSQKGTVNLASFNFTGLARSTVWVAVVRQGFMELWVGLFPFFSH